MKSFSDYMQNKNVNSLMSEIAHKMVELNVDPWNFLMEYYKNDAELVVVLEAHKEEALSEGILGRMWKGAKELLGGAGQSAYGAAQAVGGRMGEAGKAARAAVYGPEAHYAASIEALQGLSKELNKNQAVQQAMQDPQTGANYKQLVGDLQGILTQLSKQKQMVNDLLARQTGSTSVTTTPGTLGANPQAQAGGLNPSKMAAGAYQQPQPSMGSQMAAGAYQPPQPSMGSQMAAGAYQPPQTQPFPAAGGSSRRKRANP